jgi:hypothetical protein
MKLNLCFLIQLFELWIHFTYSQCYIHIYHSSFCRMLEKVCKDSQMLADIFVNYDCDLEATNLFERMVRLHSIFNV